MTGSGTLADPYVIESVSDLQAMKNDLDAHYKLGKDINAAETREWPGGFEPIGSRTDHNLLRRPDGDHSSGGVWTVFPAAPATKYDKVDEEVSDGDATYIETNLVGSWVLFAHSPAFNLPQQARNIDVLVHIVAKRGAGWTYLKAYVRVGGTNYEIGGAGGPGVNYSEMSFGADGGKSQTNPKTGVDWTPNDVNGVGANALQAFGVIITVEPSWVRFTQVWLTVSYELPFSGTLDGDGRTVFGLYINRPGTTAAVFDYVDADGDFAVRDLNLADIDYTGKWIGGLVDTADRGTYENVNILSGVIHLDNGGECGGMAEYGYGGSKFYHCNVNLTIIASGGVEIGGFIGLGGEPYTVFDDCHASVEITSIGAGENLIGGFGGDFWCSAPGDLYFRNCSAVGTVYANQGGTYGGFVGYAGGYTPFHSCTSDVDIQIEVNNDAIGNDVGGFIGYTYQDVTFDDCESNGDILITAYGNCTRGSEAGGFISFTCEREILDHCRAHGDVTIIVHGAIRTVNAGGFVSFSCDHEHYKSCCAKGDVTVTINQIINFNPDVGGFAGFMCSDELYEECFGAGDVTVSVTAPAGVWPTYVGGFAGDFDNLGSNGMLNCYELGDVSLTGDHAMVGGLLGEANKAPADTCYVKYCYSKGHVSASGANVRVGGCITGKVGGVLPTITGVFWDTQTSGQATSAGGTGKTTEEMNDLATFTGAGWDFTSIWNLISGEVITVKAGSITAGSAVLDGFLDQTIINDGYPILRWQTIVELPCDCGFEWGETAAFGNLTPVDSKNTGEAFAKALAGLEPNTKYYFRALASSSPGPIHGGTGTFTTLVGIEVETLPATNITENRARIWGRVRKVPITAMARFDWGGNIEYGAETPWAPGLISDDMFYYDLTNLAEGRAYHFRAMAMGSALVYGNDMTFTTRSPVGPVVLIQEELAHLMEVS